MNNGFCGEVLLMAHLFIICLRILLLLEIYTSGHIIGWYHWFIYEGSKVTIYQMGAKLWFIWRKI